MADSIPRSRWELSSLPLRVLALLIGHALAGCSHAPQPSPGINPSDAALNPTLEVATPLSFEHIDIDRISSAIFHATNTVRISLGLKPFKSLSQLNQAADLQASANALDQKLSHHNFVPAWATPTDRVRALGLSPSAVAENAAVLPVFQVNPDNGYIERSTGHGTVLLDGTTGAVVQPHTYASFARAIVTIWMNSPGHRANIVNPHFRYLGCSARPTKSLTGFDLVTGIQIFYTPAGR